MGAVAAVSRIVSPSLCFLREKELLPILDSSNMLSAQVSSGEPIRKEGRKGKESRRHRQHASAISSEADPVATYNIELNYGGKNASSARNDKSSRSASHRKK
jgi:hypothetical protein